MGCNTLAAFAGNQAMFTFQSVTFGWQVAGNIVKKKDGIPIFLLHFLIKHV
jgi:hypothetical protein